MTSPEEADRPQRGDSAPLRTQFSRRGRRRRPRTPARRFFRGRRARAQSQRFGPVSAASAANTRDAPRDGRPSARPRLGRAGPRLWRPRARSCGAASLCRAGRASGGPDDGPRVNRRNRPGRGAIASGRSRHRSRAPRRGQLGRARPAGPGRRRGRGRRRVNFSAPQARARRASGAFGPASRACRRLFFWMGPRSGARRARVGSENKARGRSRSRTGRRPRARRLHAGPRLQQHRRVGGSGGGGEPPPPPRSHARRNNVRFSLNRYLTTEQRGVRRGPAPKTRFFCSSGHTRPRGVSPRRGRRLAPSQRSKLIRFACVARGPCAECSCENCSSALTKQHGRARAAWRGRAHGRDRRAPS